MEFSEAGKHTRRAADRRAEWDGHSSLISLVSRLCQTVGLVMSGGVWNVLQYRLVWTECGVHNGMLCLSCGIILTSIGVQYGMPCLSCAIILTFIGVRSCRRCRLLYTVFEKGSIFTVIPVHVCSLCWLNNSFGESVSTLSGRTRWAVVELVWKYKKKMPSGEVCYLPE